jgi:hypothetical protein
MTALASPLTETQPAANLVAWRPDKYADVPTICDEADESIPYRIAILELVDGTPRVVAAVKSKRACGKIVRDLQRIHRRTLYKARLKTCPVCANYGGGPGGYVCDCPAGSMLQEQEAQLGKPMHDATVPLRHSIGAAEDAGEMYGL